MLHFARAFYGNQIFKSNQSSVKLGSALPGARELSIYLCRRENDRYGNSGIYNGAKTFVIIPVAFDNAVARVSSGVRVAAIC